MEMQTLNISHIEEILSLTKLLNPSISIETLHNRQKEMFSYPNYYCFGLREQGNLEAVMSCWISTKLYSGKQVEIDNFIVNPNIQSKGIGADFLSKIEQWATSIGCESIELNTYVSNPKSHKFYFKLDYQILGYHFVKRLIPNN